MNRCAAGHGSYGSLRGHRQPCDDDGLWLAQPFHHRTRHRHRGRSGISASTKAAMTSAPRRRERRPPTPFLPRRHPISRSSCSISGPPTPFTQAAEAWQRRIEEHTHQVGAAAATSPAASTTAPTRSPTVAESSSSESVRPHPRSRRPLNTRLSWLSPTRSACTSNRPGRASRRRTTPQSAKTPAAGLADHARSDLVRAWQ